MENQVTNATATTPAARQSDSTNERVVSPRAAIYETEEKVVLELEVPGAVRESIDATVENDELTITARRPVPADEGAEVLHRERNSLTYKRSFVLSDRIDSSAIAAAYENGVLRLDLPKVAEAQPRKITIA